MELNTHPEAIGPERALLVAHELVDNIKVREVGANRGFWVERFLKAVGLGPGYSWCAAFVYFCLIMAGVPRKNLPGHPASVLGWYEWAITNGRLITDLNSAKIARASLFFWIDGFHGHIGWFVRWLIPGALFETLEGNTNQAGSREGDGAYRKRRTVTLLRYHERFGFIDLSGLK